MRSNSSSSLLHVLTVWWVRLVQEYEAAHNVSDAAHAEQIGLLEARLEEWQRQHSVSNDEHAAEVASLREQAEAAATAAETELTALRGELTQTQEQLKDAAAERDSLAAKVRWTIAGTQPRNTVSCVGCLCGGRPTACSSGQGWQSQACLAGETASRG